MKQFKQRRSALVRNVIKDSKGRVYRNRKMRMRKSINNSVFDPEDSIADTTKIAWLLISALDRIYSALPNDIKDDIETKDREIIEYVFNKSKEIKTIVDLDIEKTDVATTINKLISRQKQIAIIAESIK